MIRKLLTRFVIPLGVVLLGVACAGAFVALKPSADKAPAAEVALLVETMEARLDSAPARVRTTGTVSADQAVTLSPEVAGRVRSVSPELVPGGRVAEGEVLFRLDARNYTAARAQRKAALAQAELEHQLELGRQEVARREWALLGADKAGASEDIALRKPQLAAAEANLESARAALAQAEADVARTVVRAPFNAVITAEAVDVGQVLSSASQAVSLVGTDRARVEVQLPVEQLEHVDIPGVNAEVGSRATVTQALGQDASVVRSATVHRLVGQLDPQTRTASLLLLIEDPAGDGGLPLLPGAYVAVDIEGRAVEGAVAVPRSALYEGDSLWLVGEDERLERREVAIGFRGAERVYVTGGLSGGERVVTSAVSTPIPGMKVRVSGEPAAAAPAPDEASAGAAEGEG